MLGLCAFALGLKQLREPDIWWQLLSGRWMIEHGAITRTDMFSYTMQGHKWVNVKWLYEVVAAGLEKAGGPEVVLLLQALVNLAIVYLLYRATKLLAEKLNTQIPVFASALSLLLFLAIVEYRMAGRPEMMSHLFCTIFIFLIWRNPTFDWKKAWLFIPLQCLWANMHEAYPVGMVIIGACAGGSLVSYILTKEKTALQQTIRTALLFLACGLIILCNPNTIQLWKQPFEIYRQVWANKYTTELFSIKDPEYWTIEAKWYITLLVLSILYWVIKIAAVVKQKQVRSFFTPVITSYLILLPLFAYLSITANRNIPFAMIVLLPSVAVMLVWLVNILRIQNIGLFQKITKQALPIAIVITGLFYVSIVSNKFYKYTNSPNRYGMHVSMLHNPTGAADFIKEHHIQGTPFSDYFVSSYLLWKLYPSFKSYIDLRDLDVFPVEFFDDYFNIYTQPEKFDTLDSKYNFNYVVVSTSQLLALQMKLFWGKGYNMVYVDPVAAIFLKSNAINEHLNNNRAIQKTFSWPAPVEEQGWAQTITKLLNPFVNYDEEDGSLQAMYAARYYNAMKDYPVSIQQLLPQMPALEDNAEANYTMGATFMQYGNALKPGPDKQRKLDSASIFIQRAKELDPNIVPNEQE
ncbi:MAG: hypothetical protein JST82_06915 [Bacteroidetes bacterium]|nr:hypothetical protein [Bacteroidota bacterium]